MATLLEAYNKVGWEAAEQVQGASSRLFAWQCDDADEEKEEEEDEDTADIFYDKESERDPPIDVDGLAAEIKEERKKQEKQYMVWVECVCAKAIFREVDDAAKNKAIRDAKMNE